jgi:hypothetical protein
MKINLDNTKYIVLLSQQYTPRDRFLAIENTASQGVSFAFYTFREITIHPSCLSLMHT